jgi:hypothetical protein
MILDIIIVDYFFIESHCDQTHRHHHHQAHDDQQRPTRAHSSQRSEFGCHLFEEVEEENTDIQMATGMGPNDVTRHLSPGMFLFS